MCRKKICEEGRKGYLLEQWGPVVVKCLAPTPKTFSNLEAWEDFVTNNDVEFTIVEGLHRYTRAFSLSFALTFLTGLQPFVLVTKNERFPGLRLTPKC